MAKLSIAHFGLRTSDVERAVDWYGAAFGARTLYRDGMAAFMSFDDEHHRFVIWNDGATVPKAENASGVDHIGFGCASLGDLADQYARLKALGIEPALCVNHGFTCSLYYRDPDGNEVELTADNFSTKAECEAFMASPAMADAMKPPTFGQVFDPDELLRLRQTGAPEEQLARIGL
jgi:catechol-2,3-dioxygenase